MLAPASRADVLSGILAEERLAYEQACAARDHHRRAFPIDADLLVSTSIMGDRYATLAAVHRQRVRVLEDLLALDVPIPAPSADGWTGDNVIRLESRR